MSVNITPATVADGNPITGALWNTEVRDFAAGVQAAWTAYTPTLTGITVGNGTLNAASCRYGKRVDVRCLFQAGTTTTYSATNFAFSLPFTANTAYTTVGSFAVGSGFVQPGATATRLPALPYITTGGVLNFLAANGAANAVVTNLVPGTFGTSAIISWSITYETA